MQHTSLITTSLINANFRNFTSVIETATFSADFDVMFSRLSVPMLLVDDRSLVLNINASAANLFRMEAEELKGQYWAGLDAQLTLIQWKQRVRGLKSEPFLHYETDILTGNEFLRPVRIEVSRVGENQNLIRLSDDLPASLGVSQVLTILLIKDREVVDMVAGAVSRRKLMLRIQKHLGTPI